jgi:hypothetical protein
MSGATNVVKDELMDSFESVDVIIVRNHISPTFREITENLVQTGRETTV